MRCCHVDAISAQILVNDFNSFVTQHRHRSQNQIQRWSTLAIILLCTLISSLLAESLWRAWRIPIGEPTPRSWQWLLGSPVQTFRTETFALLSGVVLLGFALGGLWFLVSIGIRGLHSLMRTHRR